MYFMVIVQLSILRCASLNVLKLAHNPYLHVHLYMYEYNIHGVQNMYTIALFAFFFWQL